MINVFFPRIHDMQLFTAKHMRSRRHFHMIVQIVGTAHGHICPVGLGPCTPFVSLILTTVRIIHQRWFGLGLLTMSAFASVAIEFDIVGIVGMFDGFINEMSDGLKILIVGAGLIVIR